MMLIFVSLITYTAVFLDRIVIPRSRSMIIGIHDALRDLLVGTENAALLQQLIDQRRLAVVDMRDNCYVSYIFSLLI